MRRNPCVRTLMESQNVKVSKTLMKSSSQLFCRLFLINLKELQFEKFFLSGILNLETIP